MSPQGNDLPLRNWKTSPRHGTSTGAIPTQQSFESNGEGNNHVGKRREPAPGLFPHLLAVMSRLPLLGRGSQAQEDAVYRAIPSEPDRSSSGFRQNGEEVHDIRKTDKQKGKALDARLSNPDMNSNRKTLRTSNASSRSRKSWRYSRSNTNPDLRRSGITPTGPAEEAAMLSGGIVTAGCSGDFNEYEDSGDEEAIGVLDNSDKGSDYGPPDNSPSVSLAPIFNIVTRMLRNFYFVFI